MSAKITYPSRLSKQFLQEGAREHLTGFNSVHMAHGSGLCPDYRCDTEFFRLLRQPLLLKLCEAVEGRFLKEDGPLAD